MKALTTFKRGTTKATSNTFTHVVYKYVLAPSCIAFVLLYCLNTLMQGSFPRLLNV